MNNNQAYDRMSREICLLSLPIKIVNM